MALIGKDRPGILATLSGLLLDLGCNLEDLSTSILRGHFAITLVAAAPPALSLSVARQQLAKLGRANHFTTALWEIEGDLTSDIPSHVLTLYGRDRPGIVHAIATLAAGLGVNICDMTCRMHDGDQSVYVVTIEVHVPQTLPLTHFEARVEESCRQLGFESSVQPFDSDQL